MGLPKPFHRTVRQLADGSYAYNGNGRYVSHPAYAASPTHYIRAFLLLQKDLLALFDYIEPADRNLPTYSHRLFELLLRASIEVEANLKAILSENGFTPSGRWDMNCYRKVEASHRLSEYQVNLPVWQGSSGSRTPFAAWSAGNPLPWYQAYNKSKHDRHAAFEKASFENVIDACCALVALLSAQFMGEDFSGVAYLTVGGPVNKAIGEYFEVVYPRAWPSEERYDFEWASLEQTAEPFSKFDYSSVP